MLYINQKQTILTLFLTLVIAFAFAQNEKPEREEFILKLPVDSANFYEQKVKGSPYFVKDDILQIYPGEKLYVVELSKNEISSMKVVKENLNPEKTIVIELTQQTKGGQAIKLGRTKYICRFA